MFSFKSLFLSYIKCKYEHFNGYNIWKGKAKMESTLFVSTKLTFSKNLRCLNLLLLVGSVSQRDCSPKLVLFLQAKVFVAGNSNILNILMMSTLQGQIMLIPF